MVSEGAASVPHRNLAEGTFSAPIRASWIKNPGRRAQQSLFKKPSGGFWHTAKLENHCYRAPCSAVANVPGQHWFAVGQKLLTGGPRRHSLAKDGWAHSWRGPNQRGREPGGKPCLTSPAPPVAKVSENPKACLQNRYLWGHVLNAAHFYNVRRSKSKSSFVNDANLSSDYFCL